MSSIVVRLKLMHTAVMPTWPRSGSLILLCFVMLQPGTREAASNPIVIILAVVTGVVVIFFLVNYALYVFAQQNKPKKAGKRVSFFLNLILHIMPMSLSKQV